jgi:hypothetical protein
MTHGFDLSSPLVCEGIVGDGCGGGRIFFIEEDALLVYDPLTQEKMKLLDGIEDAQNISKKACEIIIETKEKSIIFNLSLLKVIS